MAAWRRCSRSAGCAGGGQARRAAWLPPLPVPHHNPVLFDDSRQNKPALSSKPEPISVGTCSGLSFILRTMPLLAAAALRSGSSATGKAERVGSGRAGPGRDLAKRGAGTSRHRAGPGAVALRAGRRCALRGWR